jgi:hypothetical protein
MLDKPMFCKAITSKKSSRVAHQSPPDNPMARFPLTIGRRIMAGCDMLKLGPGS